MSRAQCHCSHTAQRGTSGGNTALLALALHRVCAFISQEGEIVIKKKSALPKLPSFTSGIYFCLLPAGQGNGVGLRRLRTRRAVPAPAEDAWARARAEGHCHHAGSLRGSAPPVPVPGTAEHTGHLQLRGVLPRAAALQHSHLPDVSSTQQSLLRHTKPWSDTSQHRTAGWKGP